MALKLPKFITGADAKSRIFILAAAVVAIGLIIYGIVRYFSGPATVGPTHVAEAPASAQSVPGAKTITPEYYRALSEANAQAAKQAQISGTSAIPTLVQTPGQFQQQQPACTVVCPSEVSVEDDINNQVKQNKIKPEVANQLLDLAKRNVTPDEYAAALDQLVREGKLTPEQARDLLDKYKKQYENGLLNDSGKVMDDMIKSGQLPLDTANELLALQKKHLTPAEYAAELQRLVREGKLSPEAAARLLAQYTQQQAAEKAKAAAFDLQKMVKSGQITPEAAAALADLQKRNVPVDTYSAELNRLVAAGKMTPETAAKLLNAYRQQRTTSGPAAALSAMLAQEDSREQGVLAALIKNNKLAQADANTFWATIESKAKAAQDCQNGISQLTAAKKITPDGSQILLQSCQHSVGVRAEVERLAALQGNNASAQDYANELKRAAAAGLISPEDAANLLAQYQALVAPPVAPPPGAAPAVQANLPGAAEFAQLQQRVQAANAAPTVIAPAAAPSPPPAEFAAAQAQAQAAASEEEQKRIQELQSAMSGQAQALLTAWQPPAMQHKEGTPEQPKSTTEAGGTPTSPPPGVPGQPGASAVAKGPALIKAGTIYFAVLDTAVNSDYPDTPVMATIVEGPFKGAKLLGKLSLAQNIAQTQDRVSLIFTLMDKEDWPESKSVNAFAIDPDTARTVMASSVDYHYFKRYGAIMASAFMQGFSNALTTSGSTVTSGINGTTSTHPVTTTAQNIAIGLGQVGTTIGQAISHYINLPNTVRVNAGVGIGILFMSEVSAESSSTTPGTAAAAPVAIAPVAVATTPAPAVTKSAAL